MFDVDGTLVDSEAEGHRVAFNAAFENAGLPWRWDRREYGDLLSTAGGRQRIARFLASKGHEPTEAGAVARELHAHKSRLFAEMVSAGKVPARPGAARLVHELRSSGLPLAVATTGSRSWVVPLLDRLFGSCFDPVLTSDEIPSLKPHPAVYEEALRRLRLAPTDVVAVEDSGNGCAAATAAGLSCLVVVNEYTACDQFEGASAVVDGFGTAGSPATQLSGRPVLDQDGTVSLAALRVIADTA